MSPFELADLFEKKPDQPYRLTLNSGDRIIIARPRKAVVFGDHAFCPRSSRCRSIARQSGNGFDPEHRHGRADRYTAPAAQKKTAAVIIHGLALASHPIPHGPGPPHAQPPVGGDVDFAASPPPTLIVLRPRAVLSDPHAGHCIAPSRSAVRTIFSNDVAQDSQWYSYIGIM